jgi:hypothetical protein
LISVHLIVSTILTGNATSTSLPMESSVTSGNTTDQKIGNQSLKLKQTFNLKFLVLSTQNVTSWGLKYILQLI